MRLLLTTLVVVPLALACNDPVARTPKKTPSSVPAMKIAQYEAEIAALRERLQRDSARDHRWPIINAHEHMLKAKHLPNYLAAARQIGVRQTIVVTSTQFTLFGKGEKSYATMAENWLNIRKAISDYPGEIIAFASVDPGDPDKLAHLKKMVAEGAVGVKLYSGHSNLYDGPLDSAEMEPIYAYLEKTQLPVNWHINLGKYTADFERVMAKHPNLNVMLPHYGVAFWRWNPRLAELARLMRKYPTIYVDTSLGTREILIDGMYAIADDDAHDAFVKFFDEFQDRVVYGSDSVITGNHEKTPSWYYSVLASTLDHLEQDTFTFPLAEAYARYYKKGRDASGRIRGFGLKDEILQKVYVDNPRAWLTKFRAPPPPPPVEGLTPIDASLRTDPAQSEDDGSGGEQEEPAATP